MSTVEDILMVKGPDVIVAAPDNSVEEAARLMGQANVGSVIIKDDEIVAGIFTERDMLKRVVAKGLDPKDTNLSEVMSSPVKDCGLDDSVSMCAQRLKQDYIRHLAVLEDGALVGLIGLRDVMSAQLRADAERIEELESLLGE